MKLYHIPANGLVVTEDSANTKETPHQSKSSPAGSERPVEEQQRLKCKDLTRNVLRDTIYANSDIIPTVVPVDLINSCTGNEGSLVYCIHGIQCC